MKTNDEMFGWHHQLNGHEFEQPPGQCEGQGSLACCSPWHCKESGMTEQMNNSNNAEYIMLNARTDESQPGNRLLGV